LDGFDAAQQGLFEMAVQPACSRSAWATCLEDGYAATGWLLVGLLQIAVLLAGHRAAAALAPGGAVVDRRHAIRTDVLYTLLHRLGCSASACSSASSRCSTTCSALRVQGIGTGTSTSLGRRHRPSLRASRCTWWCSTSSTTGSTAASTAFRWWWSLHSLHHSQRQMTMWSDNRNHLLDDLLRDSLLVVLGS
jgi:hypothetical protein